MFVKAYAESHGGGGGSKTGIGVQGAPKTQKFKRGTPRNAGIGSVGARKQATMTARAQARAKGIKGQ